MLKVLAGCAVVACAAVAQADVVVYEAFLDGPSESPPNASPGIGHATVTLDTLAHTMRVQTSFSGLLAGTTTSHIHAGTAAANTGTAGVATMTPTFANFPLGVTSGTYDQTFDMTAAASYNAAFITANGGTTASAEAALFGFIAQERAYLNIHTSLFTSGEIRGFLHLVPAPGATAMLGLAGMLGLRRRR